MTTLRLHSEPLKDEWLDDYGHLNEAYYLVPFTNTTWSLQDYFGIGVDYFDKTGCALYTLETHLRYVSEVRQPATMNIESIILGFDAKKIWFAHIMLVDDRVCATGEFILLHYNTLEKKATAMPDQVQSLLTEAVVQDKPQWVGRSISLVRPK